ncbi:MAG TPA: hypothetical protein PLU10_09840 [Chitinophagaceae bacterium]|nr:hypothetical protein [Chitinophagaceae bacterium]
MPQRILLIVFMMLGSKAFAGKPLLNLFHFYDTELSIGIASNGKMHVVPISAMAYWRVGKSTSRLQTGLGIRVSSNFGGSSSRYITAPPELTKGRTGISALFRPSQTNNIDSLTLQASQTNAFNLAWALRYQVNTRWAVEFNTDLIGISLGGIQKASLLYGEHSNATRNTKATPSVFNARLFGDHNLGSLQTALMVRYSVRGKHHVSAGLNYAINEYVIDKPVLYTNSDNVVVSTDRYRNKSLLFSVAYIRTLKKSH